MPRPFGVCTVCAMATVVEWHDINLIVDDCVYLLSPIVQKRGFILGWKERVSMQYTDRRPDIRYSYLNSL